MTDLKSKLTRLAALSEKDFTHPGDTLYGKQAAEHANARLAPLIDALIECAEACEKTKEILINHLEEPERQAFWAAAFALQRLERLAEGEKE